MALALARLSLSFCFFGFRGGVCATAKARHLTLTTQEEGHHNTSAASAWTLPQSLLFYLDLVVRSLLASIKLWSMATMPVERATVLPVDRRTSRIDIDQTRLHRFLNHNSLPLSMLWRTEQTLILKQSPLSSSIQSVEEKLTSEHCKNVFKFRGYQSYIRQSNDLINACDAATEREMLALVNATTDGCLAGNFVHFGGNMAQDDLGDRQPMYFDGRTVLPGRALVTQRKKDLRQLLGLEEQSVIIREYNSALFESCYAVTGTEADYRSNARPAPARPTIVLNDRHPSFVTLMEILEWRSRAAAADAPHAQPAGPARAAGRAAAGQAARPREDVARVLARRGARRPPARGRISRYRRGAPRQDPAIGASSRRDVASSRRDDGASPSVPRLFFTSDW